MSEPEGFGGPPGPGSVAWRYVGDWRLLFGTGRALLLQVAHPTVGAGVIQHSDFRADPWGRFNRTLDSLMTQVYGGADAAAESLRLRELHRTINGIDDQGRPYRALDPEAYWWVHATIFETVLADHARFGRPLALSEQVRFYDEWKALGRLLGVPPAQMPGDLAGFWSYYEAMLSERLEDNEAIRDVLDALGGNGTPPPPGWLGPDAAWLPVRTVLGFILFRVSVGTLPPVLRQRLSLPWTATDERALSALAAFARAAVPAIPVRWRYHPVAARAILSRRPGHRGTATVGP